MSLADDLNDRMLPFAKLMGVAIIEAAPEKLTAEMTVRDDLCTVNSAVHGGALMAFADTMGGMATFANLPDSAKGTTTIESKTNFIGAASAGTTLTATTTPVHRGRRTQVWQTRIETAEGRLVAVVTQTQLIL